MLSKYSLNLEFKLVYKTHLLQYLFMQVLCEILAVVRWYVFPHLHCKSCTQYERWAYFFLVETSSFLIPIISLVFPLFWFISNAIGNTLLLSRYSLLV